LSFALSGIFGLDIYCISLLEPTLTEEDLGLLFSNLPRRCVVLLEDIDSAGLNRRNDRTGETSTETSEGQTEISREIARAFKSVNENNEKTKQNQGISLSGLLNAIDGVASHEGRVLVMTTNYPEKLDDALIRPGRVDMIVEFTMATKKQIRELFIRMYSSDTPKATKQLANRNLHRAVHPDLDRETSSGDVGKIGRTSTPVSNPAHSILPLPELKGIADEFADCLPEGKFTPAEIQGFLLTRKKEPKRALAEVVAWRDAQLEAKAAKIKAKGPSTAKENITAES